MGQPCLFTGGLDTPDDLHLAAYRDTDGGTLAMGGLGEVTAATMTGASFDQVIDLALEADETVYVRVHGVGGAGSGSLSFWATAVNDLFGDAIALTPAAGGATAGTNNYASAQLPDEPTGVNGAPSQTVWWSWTAPADGEAVFETASSNITTSLDVFSGTAHVTLTSRDGKVGRAWRCR